jgi:hypothetical protein
MPTTRRFDREQQRCGVARDQPGVARHAGGHARHDGRAAHEGLQPLCPARMVELGHGVDRGLQHDFVFERLCAVAQQFDDADEIRADRIEASGLDAGIAEHRVGQMVGAVDHEDVLVVEERGEPQPDQVMHPVGIEIVMQLKDDVVRGRDVLQLAQHAAAAVDDGVGEKLAFLRQLDIVGPLRGGKHRDHDADDCHENDQSDRRGANAPRPLAVVIAPQPEYLRQSLSPHSAFPRPACLFGPHHSAKCL